MKLPQNLIDAAKNQKLIPFIGAGFSFPLNLPSWSSLIAEIASDLGYDPEILNVYGDFLQIAEYMYIQNNGIGSFQSKLDRKFNNSSIDVSKSVTHMLLTDLKAKKIYTTNWDHWIEEAFIFKKLKIDRIIGADDLIKSNSDATQIIKFHGDLSSRGNDIVFTETSYFERLSFESPLDISLRSDMLSNTILFLGYSLSDFNVRYMLFKLNKLLKSQITTTTRPPTAYIALVSKNPILESILKNSRNIEVIYLDPKNPNQSLIDLLNELVQNIP